MPKLLILLTSLFFLSCGADHFVMGNQPVLAKLRESIPAWLNKKKEFGGVYAYSVEQFVADGKTMRNWKTTIYVENDLVKCRYFQQIDGLSITLWLESASLGTLGKHTEGAPVLTLDRLYNSCYWLAIKDSSNKVIYDEDENKVLQSCYMPDDSYPNFEKIKLSGLEKSKCALEMELQQ